MYDEEKLKQMDAKSIEYPDGSMHTLYEAEQKQRAYERKIRETKRVIAAFDETFKSIKPTDHTILRESVQRAFDKNTLKLKQQEKI